MILDATGAKGKWVKQRHHHLAALTWVLATLCGGVAAAQAAERWQEAAGGAVAILPAPTEAKGIVGGSLYCVEQKWGFLLRTAEATDAVVRSVSIGIEGQVFELPAVAAAGTLQLAVATEFLDLLKQGNRMRVEAGDSHAIFSLGGSTKVIEAIAPRCSQVDMSAYEAVSLEELRPAVDEARDLFADEIALFRAATDKEPMVAATEIGLDDGKRLLFATLCGSTWYYGASGCTLSGWAASGADDGWAQVYATEGVQLYLDRRATRDGWPALVTLPAINGVEASHWLWTGDAYAVEVTHIAADEAPPAADPAQ